MLRAEALGKQGESLWSWIIKMVKVSDGVAIGAVTYLNKAKAIRESKYTSLYTLFT